MKEVIIINGTGGSGKDTFVDMCDDLCPVKNVSSVDLVKDAAKILGWDGSKDENSRKFLSDLKQLANAYNDCSFSYMMAEYEAFLHEDFDILFLHIREPEEIERCKKELDAKTLLITNNNISDITSNESDRRVKEYEYDYIIDNSGSLDELKDKAWDFVDMLRGY